MLSRKAIECFGVYWIRFSLKQTKKEINKESPDSLFASILISSALISKMPVKIYKGDMCPVSLST